MAQQNQDLLHFYLVSEIDFIRENVHVITVLPGTVYTKMTLGLNLPKFITTYPDKIAVDIYTAVKKKRNIIYS